MFINKSYAKLITKVINSNGKLRSDLLFVTQQKNRDLMQSFKRYIDFDFDS